LEDDFIIFDIAHTFGQMLKIEFQDEIHPVLVWLVLFDRPQYDVLPGLPQEELIVI